MPTFQANFLQTIALFVSSIPPRRVNRPFVRLSPSECEFRSDSLVDLFVWTECKSSSKNRLHRRTNIRTISDDEVASDDLSVQTICSSSSVKTATVAAGSITSRCSRKEPALLLQGGNKDRTCSRERRKSSLLWQARPRKKRGVVKSSIACVDGEIGSRGRQSFGGVP